MNSFPFAVSLSKKIWGDEKGDRYLGLTVGGDAEMTPRMRVASAAYAIRAAPSFNTFLDTRKTS
jgi:hypothetical protein